MISNVKMGHWSIFKEEMSEKDAKSRVASDFQFENGSLVDFQAGDERQGCKIARCKCDDFINNHLSFENR